MGPDARALIARERQLGGPSPLQRHQLRQALASAVASGMAAGAAGAAAAGTVAGGAAGTKLAAVAMGKGVAASVGSTGILGWIGGGAAVGVLLIGGVQLLRPRLEASSPPPPSATPSLSGPIQSIAPVRTEAARGAATSAPASSDPQSSPPSLPSAATRTRNRRSSPAVTDSLRAEYELIERAHQALERGDPNRALTILSEHQRDFAQGRLEEERQAARVLALCSAGRPEAQAEAVRFGKAFPQSLLGPRVRHQCRSAGTFP